MEKKNRQWQSSRCAVDGLFCWAPSCLSWLIWAPQLRWPPGCCYQSCLMSCSVGTIESLRVLLWICLFSRHSNEMCAWHANYFHSSGQNADNALNAASLTSCIECIYRFQSETNITILQHIRSGPLPPQVVWTVEKCDMETGISRKNNSENQQQEQ